MTSGKENSPARRVKVRGGDFVMLPYMGSKPGDISVPLDPKQVEELLNQVRGGKPRRIKT